MGCCGRPDNRNQKSGAPGYYERYGYLNSHQRKKQADLGISTCPMCDAYTSGDPCSICGNPKQTDKEEAK